MNTTQAGMMAREAKNGPDAKSGLGGLRQFRGLPEALLTELEDIGRIRRYEAANVVLHEGEESDFVGFVRWGFLRMQKTLSDGRQHIVGLLVEGDVFGSMFNGPMQYSVEAATETEIWAIHRPAFEAIMQRSVELERAVLLNIVNELDRARDWMVILSNQKVTGRVAGFLLVVCDRFYGVDHLLRIRGETLEVRIPVSRQDLSQLLGSRPESLSRAFHALAKSGCIEILKPDLIRILDLRALAAETGEDNPESHANLAAILRMLRHAA